MKKLMITTLATFASIIASAAISVSDVTTTQRWPWSRLIDVDFVVDCAASEKADITLTAKNGETVLTVPRAAVEGQMTVGPGLHRLTIDPAAAGFPAEVMTRFCATVTAKADPSPAYMIVDLETGTKSYTYDWSDVTWYNTDVYKTTKMVFRHVIAGSFIMGSYPDEKIDDAFDYPPHKVTLTEDYWLAVFETTGKQFESMGILTNHPEWNTPISNGDTRPIVQVGTVYHVRGDFNNPRFQPKEDSFCHKFNQKTGLKSDLPTEAQWEYACRAGTHAPYYDQTMYRGDARAKTLCRCWELCADYGIWSDWEVGKLLPNAWGFYDMLGNVAELIYDADYGSKPGVTDCDVVDPVIPPEEGKWVNVRGGRYSDNLNNTRCGARSSVDFYTQSVDISFRILVKYEL